MSKLNWRRIPEYETALKELREGHGIDISPQRVSVQPFAETGEVTLTNSTLAAIIEAAREQGERSARQQIEAEKKNPKGLGRKS